jgi:hypothetical protein
MISSHRERYVRAAKARPVAVSPATPRRERGARRAVTGVKPLRRSV